MATKKEKAIILMLTTNMSQNEIAEQLSINYTTLSRWKKKPDFIELKDKITREYLGSLSSDAVKTMRSLLRAKSEYVCFQAAADILDRTGYKPEENLKISAMQEVLIVDDIPEES